VVRAWYLASAPRVSTTTTTETPELGGEVSGTGDPSLAAQKKKKKRNNKRKKASKGDVENGAESNMSEEVDHFLVLLPQEPAPPAF
jgi:hypothetical protein